MGVKYSTDDVYQILKKRIVKLEYKAGELLNEQDLAAEFSMSRTPIRAVFQRLNYDDLLTIIPRIGAQVPPMNYKKLKSIFELTRELDGLAASMATERITKENLDKLEHIIDSLKQCKIDKDYQKAIDLDQDFHNTVYDSCGNDELKTILAKLHYQTERLWHYSERYFDDMDLFIDTLSAVLVAIKAGDKDEAASASKMHIDEFVYKIRSELL